MCGAPRNPQSPHRAAMGAAPQERPRPTARTPAVAGTVKTHCRHEHVCLLLKGSVGCCRMRHKGFMVGVPVAGKKPRGKHRRLCAASYPASEYNTSTRHSLYFRPAADAVDAHASSRTPSVTRSAIAMQASSSSARAGAQEAELLSGARVGANGSNNLLDIVCSYELRFRRLAAVQARPRC